ncbi:MAG TPA: pyridoxal-dependent decarboxylase [Pyrinomonadaceae bacterium]|jgi:aromatic-L-amino-acid decarboxylase|nr:pyridoxal-dependent decarboxylase [Pyrinomonadaceae bacterium]
MSEPKHSPRPDAEALAAAHEALGRAAADIVRDYARALDAAPLCSTASPADLEALFDEPLPREGSAPLEVLERFRRDVLPHAMNIPSPRYFGLFNPTPLPVAVWADALASAINQNGAIWRNSPSASVVEARVLRWLCQLFGYPDAAGGTLTSGGSEANLIALKCARDRAAEGARDRGLISSAPAGRLVVYASDQCHYSFTKGVDIVGIGRDNLRKIESDERFHVRVDLLREAVRRDIEEGNTPVCVAGAAGATSSGVVDPLDELADVAEEFRIWFHVDAAYGGALAFSEKHKGRLRGLERADTVTVDPHKWMFVPFACGAVLARGGARVLREAFDIMPEYMSEDRGGADIPFDFTRYGQLGTRRFNALKVWMAFKTLGVRGYAEIVDRQIELTRHLAARLSESPDFETVGEVETATTCARFVPEEFKGRPVEELDGLQKQLQQRVERGGAAWFATTILKGRRVLRFNINSLLTERRHVDDLVELLGREGAKLLEEVKAT